MPIIHARVLPDRVVLHRVSVTGGLLLVPAFLIWVMAYHWYIPGAEAALALCIGFLTVACCQRSGIVLSHFFFATSYKPILIAEESGISFDLALGPRGFIAWSNLASIRYFRHPVSRAACLGLTPCIPIVPRGPQAALLVLFLYLRYLAVGSAYVLPAKYILGDAQRIAASLTDLHVRMLARVQAEPETAEFEPIP
jgi:hypothetical protein